MANRTLKSLRHVSVEKQIAMQSGKRMGKIDLGLYYCRSN